MLVVISKYPSGANFEASPNLRDKIIKKCPRVPIEASKIKNRTCCKFKLIQTNGTINEIIKHPIDPVKINVTTALSVNDSFLV